MKRLSLICMAALLIMAASCKKEKKNDMGDGIGFRATVENHTDGSKTHLDSDLKVLWNENDAILVKNGKGETGTFKATAYDVEEAEFSDMSGELTQAFLKPDYTAFYPASAVVDGQIKLSGTQNYAENSFASGANPMMAQAQSEVLGFKNICGLLKLQLYSATSCTVGSIELTSNGKDLWGTGSVVWNNGEPKFDGDLTDGGKTITLNCGDGVKLSDNEANPTAFYFVLPDGTLASGFSVKVKEKDSEKVWDVETDKDNHIERSKITAMAAKPVAPHDPVTPSVTIKKGCKNCGEYLLSGTVTVSGSHACEFGIVYSQGDPTPTIDEGAEKIICGNATISGNYDFTVDIATLPENGKYYVRTYAKCDEVAYSDETVLYARNPLDLSNIWENGISPKPFSVSAAKKVYFSQGNLWYHTGQEKWSFAEHQFDLIDKTWGLYEDDYHLTEIYSKDSNTWIDLFGWGTSGFNNKYPYMASITDTDYGNGNSDISGTKYDWGVYNTISNSTVSGWRTLTKEEWIFLLEREDKQLQGHGKVNCVQGLIILPDEFELPEGLTFTHSDLYSDNEYTYAEWAAMEANGAVFLPAAGERKGNQIHDVGTHSLYWSSTFYAFYETGAYNACLINISDNYYNPWDQNHIHFGHSVRLVLDASSSGK